MRVEDAMSTPPVTVARSATVREAIEAMLRQSVGCVIVVSGAAPTGILTRSDGLRAAYHAGDRLRDISVRRAMTEDPVTIKPSRTLRSTLRTMENNEIKKLPVVDGFDLVGIVTMTDVARHMPVEVRESMANLSRQDEWDDAEAWQD